MVFPFFRRPDDDETTPSKPKPEPMSFCTLCGKRLLGVPQAVSSLEPGRPKNFCTMDCLIDYLDERNGMI